MPISAIGSYVPTMQEFINHWGQANVELGVLTPLLLQGGYTLANFTADRTAIENAILAVQPADNTRSNTAADRDIKKNNVRIRLTQFRAAVQGLLYGSIYTRSVPTLPTFSIGESKYLEPLDDMANLWTQINAAPPSGFTGPLLLPGTYTQALFAADVAALRAAYIAASNAAQNARIAREKRDVLLDPARARMLQYRRSVVARLSAASPLLLAIPALTPPAGSTPDAVSLSGLWNPLTLKADLTWTPSPRADLDFYSVRTAPGPTYKARDESVVAAVPKTAVTFSTNAGLAAPGADALFKVYVVTLTANEKGSATVNVSRP